jgi:hypothetical protein
MIQLLKQRQADISCFIVNELGTVHFNLSTAYDLVPPNMARTNPPGVNYESKWADAAVQNMFQFVKSSNINEKAMWWGETLM